MIKIMETKILIKKISDIMYNKNNLIIQKYKLSSYRKATKNEGYWQITFKQ